MSPVKFLVILVFILLTGCEAQNPEHYPESYNKEVDRKMFKSYFPKQQSEGVAVSGNSQSIIPICPVVSKDDDFITIEYEFVGGINSEDIALLNVFMHKRECLNNKCEWKAVADNYFLPSPYSNKARVKNYFPKGDYRLWYGYYLKKDSASQYPRFYKATCYLTID